MKHNYLRTIRIYNLWAWGMSRKRAVLVFLVVLASFVIYLAWSFHEHQLYVQRFYEETEREYGAEILPWIDPEPYLIRSYGQAAMVFGLGTVLVGVVLAVHAAPAQKAEIKK